jgi:RNA polymerase sigma-70 factor (ECF subfamily)
MDGTTATASLQTRAFLLKDDKVVDSTHQEKTDEELVSRYLNGDVTAFEDLFQRYQRPLYGYIRQMVGNPADAEDVYQETFLRAIKALPNYRHQNKFRAWLFRIARNMVIDRVRRRRDQLSYEGGDGDSLTLKETLACNRPGPDQSTIHQEIGMRIWQEVDRLPDNQREVFLLRYKSGLTFKEIANLQGSPLNTVLGRMHYAVLKLRTALGSEITEMQIATEGE